MVTKVGLEEVEWEGMLTEVNVDVERGIWTAVTLAVEEADRTEALVG